MKPMSKRTIILYWLLLLVPTLVISLAAFRLLHHEQERITEQTRNAVQDRLRIIADNLQIDVSSVEEELIDSLQQIPSTNLTETLLAWQRKNPLVRNVFVWNSRLGLQYPPSNQATTGEERRFVNRYEALFSGRITWQYATGETTSEAPSREGFLQQVEKMMGKRRELVSLARGRSKISKPMAEERDSTLQSGWIPWYAENQLYLLGWVQKDPNGPVYGMEMELMTLLSRLLTALPSEAPDGLTYALLDGVGNVIHQVGNVEIVSSVKPDLAIPLAPYLPHWQVAVFCADGLHSGRSGRGFMLLSGLLLAIFVTAIVVGSTMLTWQAHRNMVDALEKTSFVSNVSHELKTPLTSICMYADLLSSERIVNEQKRKHYLNVIALESQRLARLVNNVLDFSQLEQGKKRYHLREINLTEFLHQVLGANKLRISEAGLQLKENIADENIVVRSDHDALEQALLNLVDNVIKYATDGGELLVSLDPEKDHCKVRVMDRGPGIPVAHRIKIFEKFHRVDDSLTARQLGAGLGLSIARSMLRDLGGDLLYEPRAGGGSCFIILLPYCTPEIESMEASKP